ncbi:Sugar fermentation stimulation protein-like protein [Frankliniella fusca]|uniref:Sugar fermentation stimulation protein-like protein n=1 Tax=Frankliniella fusca TaxID=407009 RepID=A0AAE1H143_9NEOP|nr:Sugar fermentation stimulation protein-like protein [Frankliniella fusca]
MLSLSALSSRPQQQPVSGVRRWCGWTRSDLPSPPLPEMRCRARALAAAPPPWSPRARVMLVLALLLPAVVLGGRDDASGDLGYEDSDEQEHKDVSSYNGHSLVFDLSSLSVLAALKLKLVVVLLVVAAVYMLMTKGYKTQCLFGNCRPNYSTYGYYPYVDYTYVGYEVPAASSRRPGTIAAAPVGLGAKDSPHLSDLTARVWNSIDIASMAFSALNIQEDDCRRKLVCQADRAASANPILRAALSWFSPSLARYRTDRSRPRPEDSADAGELPWLRELQEQDPCEDMYPQCQHHDLPPALGGPAPAPEPQPLHPAVYLEEQGVPAPSGSLHHDAGQRHPQHRLTFQKESGPAAAATTAALAQQPWQPQLYRHEYQYEVALPTYKQPFRLAAPVDAPLPLAVPPSPSPSPLDGAGAAPDHKSTDSIGVLNGVASSPAAIATLAPQVLDGATGRSPPPGAGGDEDGAGAGAPWVGDKDHASRTRDSPPELELRSPGASSPASPPQGQGPQAPQVWRRLVFGPPGTLRTKAHSD